MHHSPGNSASMEAPFDLPFSRRVIGGVGKTYFCLDVLLLDLSPAFFAVFISVFFAKPLKCLKNKATYGISFLSIELYYF